MINSVHCKALVDLAGFDREIRRFNKIPKRDCTAVDFTNVRKAHLLVLRSAKTGVYRGDQRDSSLLRRAIIHVHTTRDAPANMMHFASADACWRWNMMVDRCWEMETQIPSTRYGHHRYKLFAQTFGPHLRAMLRRVERQGCDTADMLAHVMAMPNRV